MNIQRIAKDPRLCKALTGLSHQEFSDLVPVFEKALFELRMQKPKRKRKAGGGRLGKLPTIEAKLLALFPISQICENGYMNIQRIAKDPRLCKALTGLSHQEFSDLVPVFEKALFELRMQKPKRKRKAGGGRLGKLPTIEAKLFFILFYLKTYPTFDVLGFLTDRERSHCCESVRFLSKALKKALGRELVLPERKIGSVDEFLRKFPEVKDVFLDGTERRVQRPKDGRRQRKTYSGKKKSKHQKKYRDERRKEEDTLPFAYQVRTTA